MKREQGFYWVRLAFHGWTIMNWSGGLWMQCGNEVWWVDEELEEIDERRIERV